jgi:hypothetical protein
MNVPLIGFATLAMLFAFVGEITNSMLALVCAMLVLIWDELR